MMGVLTERRCNGKRFEKYRTQYQANISKEKKNKKQKAVSREKFFAAHDLEFTLS